MKFLITTKMITNPPPEMMTMLMDGTQQWVKGGLASGKFDVSYSIAGQPGGMAIVNVNSLEELDDIIQEFPMGPFSEIQTIPLSDLDSALAKARDQAQKMSALMG